MRFLGQFAVIYTLFTLLLMLVASSAGAGLIHVPSDEPTISAGIAVAAPGDTVLVAPGSYQENIDFQGKNIVVASHHILSGESADILGTIIDGGNPSHPDTSSCVLFHCGEDSTAVLHGFTVTGGQGTVWVDPEWPTWVWRGGGGVFIFMASPTIRYNLITDNTAIDQGEVDGAQGGGILSFQGDPRIANNKISSNEASYGGGLAIDYSGGRFTNNLFSHNSGGSVYGGGAIWTIGTWAAPIIIDNNTLVENDSPTRAGALYIWSSAVTARNNIVWGNTQEYGGPIFLVPGGTIDISYSDVEGSYPGVGNIDQDPEFVDLDCWLLDSGSPCVDTGHPDPQYNDPEDPGNPGQARWPALGTLRCDMGCYGGPESALLPCDGLTAVGEQGSSDTGFASGSGPSIQANFPNPLSRATTIRFTVPRSGETRLTVYDIKGSLVRILLSVHREAGNHQVSWNGRDEHGRPAAAGVYFLRLRNAGHETSAKLTIAR